MVWCTFADDLAYVSLDYCDAPENLLQLQVDPNQETGICYTLANGSPNTVTVKLSFVDGTFTNDQRQNKACLSDTDTENFGKYVTDYDELITLKPGEAIRKEAKIMYPKGMDGVYYGCVVYSIVEKSEINKWAGTSFSILMRKAKFVDIVVGDPANAQERGIILEEFTDEEGVNLSRNPKIRIYQDESDGKYMMQMKIKNISMAQQDVLINGKASNVLGMKSVFEEGRKILRGESLLVTKKLDNVSLYNLHIKLIVKNTPMTFGDSKPIVGILTEKVGIMIRNVVTFVTLWGLLLLGCIIFLLIKDLKKRKNKVIIKVVHDKQPTINKKNPVKKVTKKKTPAKKSIEKKPVKKTSKKKK